MQEFMANFQGIAQKSHEANNEFYTSRGVNIHKMEITQYRCANKEDQAVLQQIIQETVSATQAHSGGLSLPVCVPNSIHVLSVCPSLSLFLSSVPISPLYLYQLSGPL